jgi:uncharacterized membrane protein required for colicin V production
VFTIRGVVRGTVRQVFGLLGVLTGLWVAGWVSQWVGAHWLHARPAVVFWVLRWLVAGLAGLAVSSLWEWSGGLLAEGMKSTPFGWLDRLGGLAVGVILGLVVAAFAVLALWSLPWPRETRAWTQTSRGARLLLYGGSVTSGLASPVLPGGRWLHDRFAEAAHAVPRRTHAS